MLPAANFSSVQNSNILSGHTFPDLQTLCYCYIYVIFICSSNVMGSCVSGLDSCVGDGSHENQQFSYVGRSLIQRARWFSTNLVTVLSTTSHCFCNKISKHKAITDRFQQYSEAPEGTRPASGAALWEATIGKRHVLLSHYFWKCRHAI
jgi:hypothetical protein